MCLSSVNTNSNSKFLFGLFPRLSYDQRRSFNVAIKSMYVQLQWETYKVHILSESRTEIMWSWGLQMSQQFPYCARGGRSSPRAFLTAPQGPKRWHYHLIISVHQGSACHSPPAHQELYNTDLNTIFKTHLIPVICQVCTSLKDKR